MHVVCSSGESCSGGFTLTFGVVFAPVGKDGSRLFVLVSIWIGYVFVVVLGSDRGSVCLCVGLR